MTNTLNRRPHGAMWLAGWLGLSLAALDAGGAELMPRPRRPAPTGFDARALARPAEVSRTLRAQLRATDAFAFVATARGYEAATPKLGLRFRVDDAALRVVASRADEGEASFRLVGAGRPGEIQAIDANGVFAVDNVAGHDHPLASSWYLAGPRGLEHVVYLPKRPRGLGELVLHVDVHGLDATMGRGDVVLRDGSGRAALRYGELHVFDATGRELPAHFSTTEATIRIHVDDREARYPLVVDPLVWREQGRFTLQNEVAGDRLGIAADIDGPIAIVGQETEQKPGAAFAFRRDDQGQWSEAQALNASTASMDDRFGAAVAVSGNVIAIGAVANTVGTTGAAFIFEDDGTTLTETQRIAAPPPASDNDFGGAIALDGDWLAVGAQSQSNGAVHLYERVGGVFQPRQVLTTSAPSASFGESVALKGTVLLIGAPDETVNANAEGGAAYFYELENGMWQLADRVTANPPFIGTSDNFGIDVDVDGDFAVVGTGRDEMGLSAVAAFPFARINGVWTRENGILSTTATFSFGVEVAITGTTAIVADRGSDQVFTYNRDVNQGFWVDGPVLTPSAPLPQGSDNRQFGASLAVTGDAVVVGARIEDGTMVNSVGSAYVFQLVGGSCTTHDECSSGFCVGGVCCTQPCEACEVCNAPGMDGVCALASQGYAGEPSCSPYICDGANGACPNACSDAADCIDGASCRDGKCVKECTDAAECGAGGDCVDGFCCDSTCEGSCEACDVPDSEGTCVPIVGEPRPGRAPCAEASCTDAGYVAAATCDGSGPACVAPSAVDCAPYACTPDAGCAGTCESAADCALGFECSSGACVEAADLTPTSDDGCGCHVVGRPSKDDGWLAGLALLGLLVRRRRP